ncbi:MAG: thioredoxin domain-containing protein [Frankia sp.]|nr:thioredoxin domain-containing protein [Frankia sp.]
MSKGKGTGRPTATRPRTGDRNAARRERVAAMRAAEAARQRRRRRLTVLASVVGVLVLAAVIGIIVQTAREDNKPVVLPAAATGPENGIVVGQADAPVTLELYEDFQCPACRQMEETIGQTIDSLVDEGKIKVVYHMRSFLGPDSARAANAGAAAANEGRFREFHRVLYDNQPPENTGGFSNDKLIEFGKQAGLTSAAFVSAVNDGTYDGYVAEVDERASKRGVTSTPTAFLNGTELPNQTLFSPQAFQQAVDNAG